MVDYDGETSFAREGRNSSGANPTYLFWETTVRET